MLSYSIEEAEALLEGKLLGAQQTLANCDEDLDFLREQITVICGNNMPSNPANWRLQTLEVATARVYNWDVTIKREDKAGAGEEGQKEGLPNG